MTSSDAANNLNLVSDLVAKAQAQGADAADAVLVSGTSLSVSVRMGILENLERSEGQDIGLRVFVGKRQAIASSSDTGTKALADMVERAVAMARAVPEDTYAGLADPDQIGTGDIDLESYDATEVSEETLTNWAKTAEDAARAVEGITNTEGAGGGWGQHDVAIAASNGFAKTRSDSSVSVSASVIAGEGTGMERDYDYATAVFVSDLEDPAAIGRSAGERTMKRLNPRKAETGQVPVIYDPRVSNSLVRHLTGAINGSGIARGTSFLKEAMGDQIFPKNIQIIDDPLRLRGHRSKAFDGEGIATQRRALIEDGVLQTWILDLRTARQLGLQTTGNAARGTASPPSPSATNVYLEAGTVSPEDLIADIKSGFYVTELIGMGVNGVTGDYSRGASGFWIENGQITTPVSEMTIAGNLKNMFAHLTPANNLKFRHGTDAPTVRIEGMTVAGL